MNKFYIGSCIDFTERFNQHLSGEFDKAFTAKSIDWELFYKMDGLEYKQARNIEKHIKKMKSRNYIFNLKKYPEIFSILINKYHQADEYKPITARR